MTDEVSKPAAVGVPNSVLSAKIAELEAKVASTVDADVRAILNGILKAGEKTLAEMDALKMRIEAADKATKEVSEAAEKKLKRSNLIVAATAAGAINAADTLQFLKLTDVTTDDKGETNAGVLVNALRSLKPHLFSKTNTSAAVASPANTDPVRKSVLAMTKEEYAAAKAAIIKR